MQANQIYRMIREQRLFKTLNKKEALLVRIPEYLKEEDFPAEILQAIYDLIVHFNWSDESEKEIFEFAKHIKEKYNQWR